MVKADKHSKYLVLPNQLGRRKSVLLGFLKDRVKAKIQSWDGKFLSKVGKEFRLKW